MTNKTPESPSRFGSHSCFVVIVNYADVFISGSAEHMKLLHTSWIKGVVSLFDTFCFKHRID